MKRLSITLAALLAALLPAAFGLWGNASFSQEVPVRVPASAEVVTPTVPTASATTDDHGGDTPRDQRTEPGDDRDTPSATSTTPSGTRTTEAGDDHGGDIPRDQRTEPGDDRDAGTSGSGSGSSGPGSGGSGTDDNSGSGSGSSGSGSSGSGHSGSGRSDGWVRDTTRQGTASTVSTPGGVETVAGAGWSIQSSLP